MPKHTYDLWMVRHPSGALAFSSGCHLTRRGAIVAFKPRLLKGLTWKKAYARGARVVPVRIREI